MHPDRLRRDRLASIALAAATISPSSPAIRRTYVVVGDLTGSASVQSRPRGLM